MIVNLFLSFHIISRTYTHITFIPPDRRAEVIITFPLTIPVSHVPASLPHSLNPPMVSELLPRWQSPSPTPHHGRPFRLGGAFLCFRNGVLRTAIFRTLILVGLISNVTLLTPHVHLLFRPPARNSPSQHPNPVYSITSLPSSASPSTTPSVATPWFPHPL